MLFMNRVGDRMQTASAGARRHLPDLRPGKTLHFVVSSTVWDAPDASRVVEVDGYLTTGEYEDGRPGEVFLRVGKPGGEPAIYDAWAVAFSVALQMGVDFESFCRKFVNMSFEPSGSTRVPGIPCCTSIVDLACRWLLRVYGQGGEL